MEKQSNYKPKGFYTITPYIIVDGAEKFIQFVKDAFNAEEVSTYKKPGTDIIMHAVVKIADSFIEVSDSTPTITPMKTALHLYVPDVDSVFRKAVKAGGISKMEPRDQFYGDRESFVEDVFGNHWYISTHIKDVSEEELESHTASQS